MDELIKIIIGISGTVIGCFLGYFIRLFVEHRLAIDRIKENIRISELTHASANFRAAFAPTLSFIYLARQHGDRDRPDVDAHIKAALLAHGAAVEMFRPFVTTGNSTEYQEVWEDYRKTVAMDQYALAAEAKIENVQPDELLENKIHNILQYAEIK